MLNFIITLQQIIIDHYNNCIKLQFQILENKSAMSEEKQQFINLFEAVEEKQKQKKTIEQKHLKPEPLADAKLTKKICELIQQLLPLKQVRKGVNQVLKEITKSQVQVVILAADCDPLEIIMTLPSLCEQKNIQYCFVPSKAILGRACGIKRPVVAVGITFRQGSALYGQILELKDKIQQLFI